MSKPTLCLDFDGVIHSYTSGWQGPTVIPDPPVEGAFEFIIDAQRLFRVVVFSGRSETGAGRRAMREWFYRCAAISGHGPSEFDIQWPDNKPGAQVYVDDRGYRFTGTWPTPEELLALKPWHLKQWEEIAP